MKKLLVVLALLAVAARANATVNVTAGAPIFIANADSAAAILDRCTNPANPSYQYLNPLYANLVSWLATQPGTGNDNDATDAPQMLLEAFLYKITGDSAYLTKAKQEYGNISSTFEGWSGGRIEGGSGATANISMVAIAFSFLSEGLTAPEKADWLTRLQAPNETVDAKGGETIEPWRWHNTSTIPAIVSVGNGPGAHDQAKLNALGAHWSTWCAPCLAKVSPIGYLDDYSAQKGFSIILNAEALHNATDLNLYPLAGTHFRKGWEFWSARLRGELLKTGTADSTIAWERQVGKWDENSANALAFMAFYGGRMQQPEANAWLREIIADHDWETINNKDRAMAAFWALLWGIPSLGHATLADIPSIMVNSTQDVSYVRQGYAVGSENTYLSLMFQPVSNNFYAETPWGTIMWRRGKDNGFWDSGARTTDHDRHYSPYYNRSIAHNTVTIYDASEGIYNPKTFYIDEWKGASVSGICPNSGNVRTSICDNDGGDDIYALDGSSPDWVNAARARIPQCAYTAGTTYTVKGSRIAIDTLQTVYYREVASGDSAYAQTKQTGIRRAVTWLFDPAALVVDEIVVDKANTPVEQLWHTPRLMHCGATEELITVVAGAADIPVDGLDSRAYPADPPGGVYSMSAGDGQYIWTLNGRSAFMAIPMSITSSPDAYSSRIQLIGGPNADGVHWRQDWTVNDTYTYDATKPSFEFYIQGKNYPPGNYNCSTWPDPMVDGSHPVSGQGGVRLITDPSWRPRAWIDDGLISNGREACSWRAAFGVTPSTVSDTVLIATAIWAGPRRWGNRDFVPSDILGVGKAGYTFAKRGGTMSWLYDADDGTGVRLRMVIQRLPKFGAQVKTSISWDKPFGSITRVAGDANFSNRAPTRNPMFRQVGMTSADRRWRRVAGNNQFPTGACCNADGECFVTLQLICQTQGGTFFGNQPCEPNPCVAQTGECCIDGTCSVISRPACTAAGGWWLNYGGDCSGSPCATGGRGACCFADGSCGMRFYSNCISGSGTYQGAGTDCAVNPCPAPPATGACCEPDFTCSYRTGVDCLGRDGVYQGDGSTCAGNPCAVTLGACCATDGTCTTVSEPDCDTGIYQGDATTCSPNPCAQPTGACCALDGTCTVVEAADCVPPATYQGDDASCSPNPCAAPPAPEGDLIDHVLFNCQPGGVYDIYYTDVPFPDPMLDFTWGGAAMADAQGVVRFTLGSAHYEQAKAVMR